MGRSPRRPTTRPRDSRLHHASSPPRDRPRPVCSTSTARRRHAEPDRHPPRGRPARHRARRHPLRRPARRCPGDHLLPARDHDALAQEGRRQRRQGPAQDRRRLRPGPARPAGPDGHRDQRAADLQRRGAQGGRPRSSPTTTSPGPQPIADERDGQRRRRQRGRRLLRRRGQEGRADLGRGRGACGWGSSSSTPTWRSWTPSGSSWASSDDAALVWRDGFTSIIAPEDGKYIIQVRESAYSGNGACLYRLHVGNFPRATAVMPAGGKPGETLAVRWIGDAAGETTTTVTLPAAPRARVRPACARTTRGSPPTQRLPADAAGQRDRDRAQRRPGARHAVHRPRWP